MRVRSADFWTYGERLLAWGPTERRARDHAALRANLETEGVARATSAEWERLLRHHRVVVGAGTRTVDPTRLLEVFTWFRGAQLGAPQRFATSLPPERLSQRLTAAGIPHTFGAITAANHWSFYEPAPSIQLYVPARSQGAARRLLDEPGTRGRGELFADHPNRLVVRGRDLRAIARACDAPSDAYRAADLDVASSAPFPVTSRFLSLLDCRVHPEGASHAAFLQQQLTRGGR